MFDIFNKKDKKKDNELVEYEDYEDIKLDEPSFLTELENLDKNQLELDKSVVKEEYKLEKSKVHASSKRNELLINESSKAITNTIDATKDISTTIIREGSALASTAITAASDTLNHMANTLAKLSEIAAQAASDRRNDKKFKQYMEEFNEQQKRTLSNIEKLQNELIEGKVKDSEALTSIINALEKRYNQISADKIKAYEVHMSKL